MAEKNTFPAYPGWETVRKIGAGSYGAVYEIERDLFGQKEKAALKVLSVPQSESDVEELYSNGYDDASITEHFRSCLEDTIREYQIMSEMKGHTNIVYCDDIQYVQKDDGFGWDIYIRMELLTSLTKVVDSKLSEEQVIKLGLDISNALALCRSQNIIHRDIKPQNIFVSKDGDYKLGDFGIAKTVEKTSGGTKIGTYNYMAPEVYNNAPYGHAADIYSLGLVMYWMLNERRMPFVPLPPAVPKSTEIDAARLRRFQGEKLTAPLHGSEELKRIVLKACAYDPKDRYHIAEEMREDLLALTTGALAAQKEIIKEAEQNEVYEDVTVSAQKRSGSKTEANEDEDETVSAFLGEETIQEAKTVPVSSPKSRKGLVIGIVAAVLVIAAGIGIRGLFKPAALPSVNINAEETSPTSPAETIDDQVERYSSEDDSPTIDADAIAENREIVQPITAPDVPQQVTASEAEVNKALISWQPVSSADYYEVEYYSPKYDTWITDQNYSTGTSYISNGLSAYDAYQFRVRAVNAAGASDWAVVTFERKTTVPLPPNNLKAVSHGSDTAMISWNASSGAQYYEVQYYGRSSDSWKSDPDYTSGVSYISTGLSYYDVYEYRVRAVNEAGSSAWSNCAYWTTSFEPSTPTGLSAEPYGEDSAKISWNSSDYISYYEVQYYSVKAGAWKAEESYSSDISTCYISKGLSVFDSYVFRVREVNPFGASSWATITYTKPAAPDPPEGLWVENDGDGKARISWNDSKAAYSYEVQYYSPKDGVWKTDDDYSGGTSYVTTGLQYDSYRFRVRAKNSFGAASDWTEIEFSID